MAATAWLMLSFSSGMCGFDSYTLLFKYPQGKFLPPPMEGGGGNEGGKEIFSGDSHDTGTEGQHQPRNCSHQNHYVTLGTPQHC